MTWQLYAIAALSVFVLAGVAAVVSLVGLDGGMIVGLAVGGGLSVALMWFGRLTLRRAVREDSHAAMMGHIYGGFGLRLVLLVVGFFALALSGLGNPAGFAVAFMAGVAMSLGWQALAFTRETARRQPAS